MSNHYANHTSILKLSSRIAKCAFDDIDGYAIVGTFSTVSVRFILFSFFLFYLETLVNKIKMRIFGSNNV